VKVDRDGTHTKGQKICFGFAGFGCGSVATPKDIFPRHMGGDLVYGLIVIGTC
jgi:hypothetical protein